MIFESSVSGGEAEAVDCPRCGQEGGAACRSPAGRWVLFPHIVRVEAVLTKRREELRAKMGRCRSASDGECNAKDCPQLADGEPARSGRHCPIDHPDDHES